MADFGTAVSLGKGLPDTQTIAGTPHYMTRPLIGKKAALFVMKQDGREDGRDGDGEGRRGGIGFGKMSTG